MLISGRSSDFHKNKATELIELNTDSSYMAVLAFGGDYGGSEVAIVSFGGDYRVTEVAILSFGGDYGGPRFFWQ